MLNKAQLANDLKNLYAKMQSQVEAGMPMSEDEYAQELATIIDAYVRTALVTIDTFAASNSAGPIAGTATGTLQ